MMNETLKSILLDVYRDVLDTGALAEFDRMLEEMWRACLDRRAFGYSAHYEAVVWTLPDLFREVKRFIRDKAQLKRFCRAIPAIVQWLPYDSEEGPFGYTHTILTGSYLSRAAACATFDEFVGAFEGARVRVCRDCGKNLHEERHGGSYVLTCPCGFVVVC